MTLQTRLYATLLASLLGLAGPVHADTNELKARYAGLTEQLARSPFQRSLVLESTETAGDLKGEICAVMDHAFSTIAGALKQPENWCDVLILHLNVKQCGVDGAMLAVVIGHKYDQPVADAYKVDFNYKVAAQSADYLHVQLSADAGPLGTRNYRIAFEAVPLDARRSFIRMTYAYGHGFAARVAMQSYLATIGSSKVGFSVVGPNPDGTPVLIDNVRGVVERNTMRYYLAIDAYLNSLAMPAGEQVEKRLRDWYAATERYPRQLHEMECDDYMNMKRKEVKRPQEG